MAGVRVWALTPRAPAGASAPRLAREAHARTGALSFQGDRHHGLPLLTARYSKAWLTDPGHGSALLINSVPSNYSMENRL